MAHQPTHSYTPFKPGFSIGAIDGRKGAILGAGCVGENAGGVVGKLDEAGVDVIGAVDVVGTASTRRQNNARVVKGDDVAVPDEELGRWVRTFLMGEPYRRPRANTNARLNRFVDILPISFDIERQGAGFGGNRAAFFPGVALSLESVEFGAKSVQDVIVVLAEEEEDGVG